MTLVYPTESHAAHPPRLSPDYQELDGARAAKAARHPDAPHAVGTDRPGLRPRDGRPGDHDLTTMHAGEPLGERIIVHGTVSDEDGRGVPNTLVEIWQANACGRYVHVVDQHPAPLDPNFTGAGRAADRRAGQLQIRHRQARRLSVGQSLQCLASGAHPFLRVRPFLCLASGDADVFSGRSAVSVRSDFQFGDRREARCGWCRLSISTPPSRTGRCPIASTSFCAAATPPRWVT